ncbi:MAG: SRPBCC family protein [Flavobacteriaceae bacterium]|nr:SRPBCC family protein [Flavobacteriaceae bacterium]
MNLESPTVTASKSGKDMYEFLADPANFEKIMPENIDKFETRENGFVFALKGMPEIKLKVKELIPHSTVILGAASDKLPFTLTGNIYEIDENSSEVQLVFNGKFNPMMAMMIKSPLKRFINTLSENIEEL